jgi:uncharacterized protein (DUF305 family)
MNRFTLPRRGLLAVAAAATLALAAGCGDNGTGGSGNAGSGTTGTAPATAGAFNDADVTFAQNMIPHHQQAVQMAELAATKATDSQLKQLAAQIKAAQDPEIATMTGWLSGWDKPTAPAMGHEGMSMPGMMSEAEMTKLMGSSGVEFDRMFAQMMIAHHNGAIQMAKDEQANGSNAAVKALAATVASAQTAEVTQLQTILDRL